MTRKEELLGGDLIALSAAIDSSIPTTMQSSNADAFAEGTSLHVLVVGC
uniref:Uncharacterized protein n=1 Tax=Parascaris equorum TaxID=6256 RepID=A0A914R431_PAREQ